MRNGVFVFIAYAPFLCKVKAIKRNFKFYGQFTPMSSFVKDQDKGQDKG